MPNTTLPCTYVGCPGRFDPTLVSNDGTVGLTGWSYPNEALADDDERVPAHDCTYQPRALLTLDIEGAGTVEVIEFYKNDNLRSLVLARWSDQYVIWALYPKPLSFEEMVGGVKRPVWTTGTGIYCANDLSLARRTFHTKRDRDF